MPGLSRKRVCVCAFDMIDGISLLSPALRNLPSLLLMASDEARFQGLLGVSRSISAGLREISSRTMPSVADLRIVASDEHNQAGHEILRRFRPMRLAIPGTYLHQASARPMASSTKSSDVRIEPPHRIKPDARDFDAPVGNTPNGSSATTVRRPSPLDERR